MECKKDFGKAAGAERQIREFLKVAPKILLPEQAKVIEEYDRLNRANDKSPLTRRTYIGCLLPASRKCYKCGDSKMWPLWAYKRRPPEPFLARRPKSIKHQSSMVSFIR